MYTYTNCMCVCERVCVYVFAHTYSNFLSSMHNYTLLFTSIDEDQLKTVILDQLTWRKGAGSPITCGIKGTSGSQSIAVLLHPLYSDLCLTSHSVSLIMAPL